LSEDNARDRVASQGDVRVKARRALERGPGKGFVIWNDEEKDELVTEVERVVRGLQATYPKWRSWLNLMCPLLAVLEWTWSFLTNRRINRRWEESELDKRAKQ
jgi:dephospho-CoA kinase